DWGDWLGTHTVATRSRQYWPFEKARSYVRDLGLKWFKGCLPYCKSGKKPDGILANPNKEKANKGWGGGGDFLGTGRIADRERVYRPFEQARKFARRQGLRNGAEWTAFKRSGKLPSDIPAAPWQTYKDKGWVSMGDWLGTGTVAYGKQQYL